MSIVDSLSPAGSGPPRHVHDREDETFVVLTGECEFWLEGTSFIRGPGESAFIPRGREHTFRVAGSEPSRHLLILTPGGFESFFAEMAQASFRISGGYGAGGCLGGAAQLALHRPAARGRVKPSPSILEYP
jgi:hypothetical protein